MPIHSSECFIAGDFSPTTLLGQLATMVMLLIVFTVLPIMSSKLVDALNA